MLFGEIVSSRCWLHHISLMTHFCSDEMVSRWWDRLCVINIWMESEYVCFLRRQAGRRACPSLPACARAKGLSSLSSIPAKQKEECGHTDTFVTAPWDSLTEASGRHILLAWCTGCHLWKNNRDQLGEIEQFRCWATLGQVGDFAQVYSKMLHDFTVGEERHENATKIKH